MSLIASLLQLHLGEKFSPTDLLCAGGRILAVCIGTSLLVVYQLVSGVTAEHIGPDTGLRKGLLAGALAITFAILVYIPIGVPLRQPGLFTRPLK